MEQNTEILLNNLNSDFASVFEEQDDDNLRQDESETPLPQSSIPQTEITEQTLNSPNKPDSLQAEVVEEYKADIASSVAANSVQSILSTIPSFLDIDFQFTEILQNSFFRFLTDNVPKSQSIIQSISSNVSYDFERGDLGEKTQTELFYEAGFTSSSNNFLISLLEDPTVVTSSVKPTFQPVEPEPSYAVLSSLTHMGTVAGDTISGNNMAINVIDGKEGDDTLSGRQLEDQIWGGDGNDTISAGNGDDKLVGAAGNDIILGENGDDLIWGGLGLDNLTGGNGDDFLSGNEGDDIIYGSIGSDTIFGGDGNDVIYALDNGVSAVKTDLLYTNVINGGAGSDTIYGSSGANTLNGGNGNDVITSASGAGDSYEDHVLALNPLVYYRLGETSGSTAYDATGNYNASYASGIKLEQSSFKAGIENRSVEFSGANDQVVAAADHAMFDTTQGTVTAWFKLANSNTNHAVFAKDGSGNIDGQFYLGVNNAGDIYGRVQQGGADDYFTFDPTAAIGGKVQVGQWYMLTMSYGAGGANFYINDQLLGSSALLTKTDSNRDFIIGGRNSSASPSEEFQGQIDEVAWLTGELDATGVNNLYNAGINAVLDVQNTSALNGGNGDDTLVGGQGIDHLSGGDGLDTLYGGEDGDTFLFESISAFNDVDVIQDYDASEGDVIDISDVLSGYGVNAGNISDYVDVNISGDDSYYDYIMALNPLVYFRLDETSGTVAVDSAGNANGTYKGTPALAQAGFNAGVSNGAATFDGTNDEIVEVADSALFDTTQGTVSAWFNLTDTNSNYTVYAKDGNGSVDGQFYLGVDSTGDVYGRFQHSGINDVVSYDPTAALGGKVQAGQWYMLTMSYGAGGVDVYINGQLIGSSATLVSTNSDRSFLIGARNSSSSPDTEFNGSIDEVMWLSDQLAATEINNLYNAGVNALDHLVNPNGLYIDTTGSGSFNAGNLVAGFSDLTNLDDELTMFNNGSLIV